jgi:hypothetical protein
MPGSGTYRQVMEPGGVQQLQRWGIRSVELWVILSILPMVNGFSIADLEKMLLLIDIQLCGYLLGPSDLPFYGVVGCHETIGMSTISHLNLSICPWSWQFSLFIWILATLAISYKWNHNTCGLLHLASFT